MRITSGNARGIELKSPKGDSTRPATDAARQAIFSSLGECVSGANVLDMFAGTGSYGLEAASRGAASATFIESDRRALAALKENIESVKSAMRENPPALRAVGTDCCTFFNDKPKESFDLIFADPPYALLLEKKSLDRILGALRAAASAESLIILEAPAQFELPEDAGFEIVKRLGKKSKGKPSQIIFKIKNI